jgi:hypothetical protein
VDYGRIWASTNGNISMKIKKICESCSATFVVVHELDEDDYIEQYCPFCGAEHEQVEEDVLLNEDWD